MIEQLKASFNTPGSPYRAKPFWAWNGKLDPEELRRQIRIMHKMGLGGFFMHSRVGLNTPYLGDDWFACVNACIDEASKLDMEAWLYDEDRWPSGAAGGLVTQNPDYRIRGLAMAILENGEAIDWEQSPLAAFTAHRENNNLTSVKRLSEGCDAHGTKSQPLLVFHVNVAEPSPWFNEQTYLDTMNHEAVKAFIEVTHENYRKQCGQHFGKLIPGIFTDEPNYHHGIDDALPWTGALPKTFEERYGYDLMQHLPELFFTVDDRLVSTVRRDYRDCITHLFVDAFGRQIGEWCDANGIAHTGHLLAEDTLTSQTQVVGSAMRFYEYMQAPGMDLLTEHWRIYDTAKQVSSMARQFGRPWRLTETYGCTGWDFPFLGHKALGDWQAALGINLRCQHLSWYTMEGEAKRDYPASILHQSPWWEHYSKVEDYFARVNAVMTRGKELRNVLVIHPIESAWALEHEYSIDEGPLHHCTAAMRKVRDSLLAANIDFDYGDEAILEKHASVSRNTTGTPLLKVKEADYRAVVLPPMVTVRSSTLNLLQAFRDKGGTVVFAGKPPANVDATPSEQATELAAQCHVAPESGKPLADAVETTGRLISILDDTDNEIEATLHLLREDSDAFYLFVVNTGHGKNQVPFGGNEDVMARDRRAAFEHVRVVGLSDCAGHPLELDPDTGAMYKADAEKSGAWTIHTSLPALGSRLFVIPKKQAAMDLPARPRQTTAREHSLKEDNWNYRLSESNVLVLDRCAYRIGDGAWQTPDEILRIDTALRTSLGVAPRGGQMVQPWARKHPSEPRHTTVELAYEFDVKSIPDGACFLCIENPATFTAEMNGTHLSMDAESGWWCDKSLRRIPLDPAILKRGKNRLRLTCDYSETHSGLEIIYLLGPFGVDVKATRVILTDLPDTLAVGDWVKQGLPFYSGSVTYTTAIRPQLTKGERLIIRLPEYRGAAARILVDGREAGIIAWEPNECDITDCLVDGQAELEIEILGHRRNSHGPLHYGEKWPQWTGSGQFTSTGDMWKDNYQLVPCGLLEPPRLEVRR